MLLQKFNGGWKYTHFDPSNGTGGEFQELENAEIAGFCEEIDGYWVVVYPSPDEHTMIVQVNTQTWDLFSPETQVTYYRKYDDAKTYFKIENDTKRFNITYDAWSKDVPHFEVNK
ncbi:hypothetical protein [Halogeometricum borinquense]|uniref:hypothetical protein n=1 Tax=Halogeometricum borinquense TaxID=60847 RepID=UPI0034477CEF